MRILMTNIVLCGLTGTECFTLDLATELKMRGHELVIYSPTLGPILEQFKARDLVVVDRLGPLKFQPDIIHGHHLGPTATALLKYPKTPAIFVSHGLHTRQDGFAPLSQVHAWVGVCDLRAARLIHEGADPSSTHIISNGVDTERIAPRRQPNDASPRRALVVSKRSAEAGQQWTSVLRGKGMIVDHVGTALGTKIPNISEHFERYDIVIACGRTALEASAAGCFVILSEGPRMAGAMTAATIPEFQKNNFGENAMTQDLDDAAMIKAIDKYSPALAKESMDVVRDTLNLRVMADQYEALYRDTLVTLRDNGIRNDRNSIADLMSELLPSQSGLDENREKAKHLKKELDQLSQAHKALLSDNDPREAISLAPVWTQANPKDPKGFRLLDGWRLKHPKALYTTGAAASLLVRLPDEKPIMSLEMLIVPEFNPEDDDDIERLIKISINGSTMRNLIIERVGEWPHRHFYRLDLGELGISTDAWLHIRFVIENPWSDENGRMHGLRLARLRAHPSKVPLQRDVPPGKLGILASN